MPRVIHYRIVKNEDGTFTGFCPTMKPVRFTGKTEDRVKDLVVKGIRMYIERRPEILEQLGEEQEIRV